MKLIQRIGYYLGGFSIGLVILAFFLNGKKTSCSYSPESRVIKRINSKPLQFSPELLDGIASNTIDTTGLKLLMKKGNVNFGNSQAQRKRCGLYVFEGDLNQKNAEALIEFCHKDSTATLTKLTYK